MAPGELPLDLVTLKEMDSRHGRSRTKDSAEEISYSVHTSFSEIEALANAWDALVERADGDVFSTFDWCRTWWEFYGKGRQLRVLVVREEDRPVAIWPLFLESLRLWGVRVQFVRLVGCDHSVTTCNAVIEPGMEQQASQALAACLDEWCGNWDAVHFGLLPGYSDRIDVLRQSLEDHFPTARVVEQGECPHTVFELPTEYDTYLTSLSKRERSNVRQDERRLQREHDAGHVVHIYNHDLQRSFEHFVSMHQALWKAKGALGHFDDWPDAQEFHNSFVKRSGPKGRAFVAELVADGKVIASQYGFRFGRYLHWFLTARSEDPHWRKWSLGRMGLLRLIRYAIEAGAERVDGLVGYYEYKLKAGGRLEQARSIMIVQPGWHVRTRLGLFRAFAWLLNKAYYRLWFARLAPKLGLLRGPLWDSWIRTRI